MNFLTFVNFRGTKLSFHKENKRQGVLIELEDFIKLKMNFLFVSGLFTNEPLCRAWSLHLLINVCYLTRSSEF